MSMKIQYLYWFAVVNTLPGCKAPECVREVAIPTTLWFWEWEGSKENIQRARQMVGDDIFEDVTFILVEKKS